MQNIKNFSQYVPSPEQIQEDLEATGKYYDYLKSESGLDWYECYSLYSDETIKLMYDENNVVQGVVSEPVPERGNIYAVSMFFPLNMSVAEIEGPLPHGFELDSKTWVFDGEVVYQDASLLASIIYSNNAGRQLKLMTQAAAYGFSIQSSAAIGNPRSGDAENFLAIQQYTDALRDVDLTIANAVWPDKPDFKGGSNGN